MDVKIYEMGNTVLERKCLATNFKPFPPFTGWHSLERNMAGSLIKSPCKHAEVRPPSELYQGLDLSRWMTDHTQSLMLLKEKFNNTYSPHRNKRHGSPHKVKGLEAEGGVRGAQRLWPSLGFLQEKQSKAR